MNRVDKADRELLQAVGEHIRELRLERGLSQEQVALRTGITRAYYSGIERGTNNMTLLSLRRLAAVLGVEVAVLLPPMEDQPGEFSSTVPPAMSAAYHANSVDNIDSGQPSSESVGHVQSHIYEGVQESQHQEGHGQGPEQQWKEKGTDGKWRWRRPSKASHRQQKAEKTPTFISAGVVAQMCSVSRRTVARWVEAGTVPVAEYVVDSFGTVAPLFRREDIARYAETLRKGRSKRNLKAEAGTEIDIAEAADEVNDKA